MSTEDVDTKITKKLDSIIKKVDEVKYPSWMSPQQVGRLKHLEMQKLIDKDKVLKGRVFTETFLDDKGVILPYKQAGSVGPDVVILKEGVDIEKLAGKSLAGKVDAVMDLKTGKAGIDERWATRVSEALEIGVEDIHGVGGGRGVLSEVIEKAKAAKLLAENVMSNPAVANTLKTGGKAFFIAMAFMAYSDAKANGMSDSGAAVYAASSTVGGDVIYDVGEGIANKYWNTAHDLASKTAPSAHILGLERALADKLGKGGDTTKMDAWFSQQMKSGQGNTNYSPPSLDK